MLQHLEDEPGGLVSDIRASAFAKRMLLILEDCSYEYKFLSSTHAGRELARHNQAPTID